MKIFVVGASGAGKTPMATHLAAALGVAHVRASAWARARFPRTPDDFADRQAFVDAITAFSLAELRRDPFVCLDDIGARVAAPCVIEGVRNPFDFVHLHDPRVDATVWLEHHGSELAPTDFERGLDVIDAYLRWLAQLGLGGGPVLRYRYRHFRRSDGAPSLDDAIDDAIARLRALAAPAPAPLVTSRVHAPIPPLRRHVRAEYLYGMDPARVGELVPCTAFCVSSYPGEAPTFQILLADGAVFSYVPPSALIDPARRAPPELALDELVYANCPDEQIVVHAHEALAGRVLAYVKQRDLWLGGEYLFTVEWWTGNLLAHAIALDNGQLAMLPHHKLKFGEHAPGFAPYRKLRRIWRVGS